MRTWGRDTTHLGPGLSDRHRGRAGTRPQTGVGTTTPTSDGSPVTAGGHGCKDTLKDYSSGTHRPPSTRRTPPEETVTQGSRLGPRHTDDSTTTLRSNVRRLFRVRSASETSRKSATQLTQIPTDPSCSSCEERRGESQPVDVSRDFKDLTSSEKTG